MLAKVDTWHCLGGKVTSFVELPTDKTESEYKWFSSYSVSERPKSYAAPPI